MRDVTSLLPTPTSRDWKDGDTRNADVEDNGLLGQVVWSIGDSTDPPLNDGGLF
jgi:hypothetical protein